ncbi:MAG: hypothetical protein JWQ49_4745 [Edaphobacter sp.]|nr:hypothetical protein [Edaphobacter sp.]
MTQAQAAAILGIDQPKFYALKQGRLSGFLDRAHMRLGRRTPGRVRVVPAGPNLGNREDAFDSSLVVRAPAPVNA